MLFFDFIMTVEFLKYSYFHFMNTKTHIANNYSGNLLEPLLDKAKKKLKMLTLCQHPALFLHPIEIFPLSR